MTGLTFTDQKTQSTLGIITTLLLLYFVLTKCFGFIHIEDKALLGWSLFSSLCLVVIRIAIYAKYIENNKFLIWDETKRGFMFYMKTVVGLFALVVVLGIIKTKLGISESSSEIANN